MAKMKIFELKNMINEKTNRKVESKDIQDFLEKSLGVKKTHSSNLEDNEVRVVQEHFIGQTKKPASPAGTGAAANPAVRPAVAAQGAVRTQAAAGTVRTGLPGQSRPSADSQARPTGDTSQRPAAQSGVRQGGQSQVYHAGGTGAGTSQAGHRPAGEAGQRPASQSSARTGSQAQGYQGQTQHSGMTHSSNATGHRAMGDGRQRPAGDSSQRPAGQNRPSGEGQSRPVGQGHGSGSGQRPSNQGGMRQSNQGQRPYGDRSAGQGVQSQSYQGNRPYGDGQRPYGDRPAGQGQGGNRSGGYQGQGYQGNRPSGDGQRPYGDRPAGQGQGGNRPGGYQGQGYQGNRPSGDGQRPYSDRPAGQGNSYNNQNRRPYSQDGSRPQGQGGYQGNRPYGDRPAGQGQGGYQRPAGQGGYSRPAGQQGGGQRPGGGYAPRGGFDGGFQKKDEDDKPSYNNRGGQGAKKGSGARGGERKNFDQQILDQKVAEKSDNKRSRDRINKDKLHKDKGILPNENDDDKNIIKIAPKKGQFIQPKPVAPVAEDAIKTISLSEVLTIKELADKMKLPSSVLVKKLFLAGKMVSINQEITYEEAEEIALEYDIIAEKEVKVNEVEELLKEDEDNPDTMVKRPPVVCVMGHVDHGKTSLLDAIRETNVTSREAGGITQHIGAYIVEINGEKITFLDTPGHEAFTSMRMRGAKATDIAILVVAADDGVMPQTIEAISHAKAAGVQIIVAINKIDKPSANIERVKQELTEYELIAEDWGGDTIFAPVSAHTKEGIDHLLEMILLTAEMGELKANPNRNARGLVIEAELDKGRGPVATILVQKGTLHVGDNVAVGASFGKVRAMMDDKGRRVKEAGPSTPVEILGLNEVPGVGEIFLATGSEKEARTIAEAFISQSKEKLIADTKAKLSLDGLFSQIQAGNIKELNLIIKADVQGSVEAMKQSLLKLSNDEVVVRVLHGGVGAINESDVILASTSNAIIIGFNVKPDNAAKETADREKIDIKLYRVIYNAIDDIEAAMKGMLDPVFEERVIGHAEIRQTFKASGIGIIAGSYVLDGKVIRGSKARIYRDNAKIYDGILASLKRFQDDVKEVATGYECGLVFEKFNDIKEGDKVELYIMAEVPR